LGVARSVHTSSRAIGGGAGFKAGNDGHHALATELAREYSVDFSRALHISRHYGTGGHAVLSYARAFSDDTRLGESQYTEAEIRWIIRHEYVCRLADLLQRRTSLAITGAVNART